MTIDSATVHNFNYSTSGPALVRGRDYSLDDAGIELVLASHLAPRLADLLDIALAAHVVDRIERRPGATVTAFGVTWGRPLVLRVGVRDEAFWLDNVDALTSLLSWLTDDAWLFEFARFGGRPFRTEIADHLPLPRTAAPDCVALFSGGLDSLAGALLAFAAGRRPMLLSVETNSRMAAGQRLLRTMLRRHWPLAWSASAAVELHGGESRDASQRARAFLFLALAGVVAASSGIGVVEVYENGVGAIGLPYVANQEGAHTTKAMHPRTLNSFSALLGLVADRPIEYINPSLWFTKAQLCEMVPQAQQQLIPLSESCDAAYSYRGDGVARCGTCTSCLLRRQALWGAGLGTLDRSQPVRIDLIDDGCQPAQPSAAQLLNMLDQAEHLATALGQVQPWAALTRRFPELLEVATSPTEQRACLRLFHTYVDEWRRFPSPLVDRYLDRYTRLAQGGCAHG